MAKKRGRPSIADKIDKDQLKWLYLDGKTDQEIADFFKISRRSLINWRKKNPEFVLTLKDDWKAVADHRVERSLYERACGYSHTEDKIFIHEGKPIIVPTVRHYPPDPTSMIFWLKNRQPGQWRDKVEQADTEATPTPVTVNIQVEDGRVNAKGD